MPRTASLVVKLICPDEVICLQEDKQRTASRGVKLICPDGVICLQEDKQRTVKLGVKSSMSWLGLHVYCMLKLQCSSTIKIHISVLV